MMLKEKILDLKRQGLSNKQISLTLECSTSSVSYHTNSKSKEKVLQRNKIKQKLKQEQKLLNLDKSKDLTVFPKKVCWKHAEAACITKLIEFGYEVFMPFNGGGEIDTIVFKNGTCYKVQIKSISPKNTDFITISLKRNILRNSFNKKVRKSSSYQNIDFFMIYDGTYFFKLLKEDTQDSIILRYKKPLQKSENTHLAYDYLFI